jgi:hypothetical protein
MARHEWAADVSVWLSDRHARQLLAGKPVSVRATVVHPRHDLYCRHCGRSLGRSGLLEECPTRKEN